MKLNNKMTEKELKTIGLVVQPNLFDKVKVSLVKISTGEVVGNADYKDKLYENIILDNSKL